MLADRKRRRRIVAVVEKLAGRYFTRLLHFVRELRCAELSHRQELQHAILYVFESIVVFLENRLGAFEIELIVRSLVPWQLRHPFEIGANHLRFHRLTTSAFQAPELALNLLARLPRQLQLCQLVAKLRDLFARIVVAQLFLDRLELFAQIHLALALPQLLLDLRLDVFLCFQQSNLALHVDQNPAQPLLDAQRLQ